MINVLNKNKYILSQPLMPTLINEWGIWVDESSFLNNESVILIKEKFVDTIDIQRIGLFFALKIYKNHFFIKNT